MFVCPKTKIYTLPRSESSMLVTWAVPVVTDNSGESVNLTVSPYFLAPAMLNAGINEIIYSATDKTGNKESCKVILDVQGKINFVYIIHLSSVCGWMFGVDFILFRKLRRFKAG